ncbi:MAG: T9SS type A sorting domain-containing protein [Saprospiraceae bacterium]|nr:T9SS type A sorting domain-containing protein [Saprospiraceae bacterium]
MQISKYQKNIIHGSNPAQDHIFSQIENYQKDSEYGFQMYDVIGQFVNGGLLNEKQRILGVSLPDGVYFIQIIKRNTAEDHKESI